MKKVFKRIAMSVLVLTAIASTSISVYAMDSRIKKSSVSSYTCVEGIYASGYVTADDYHYANAQLHRMQDGGVAVSSGRIWGSGKVPACTDVYPDTCIGRQYKYYARIYYGFDE